MLAVAAGWVVRAPFTERFAARPPDIDLTQDLPAFHEGVVVSTGTPTLRAAAGAPVAASTASGAGADSDGEECGTKDGPQYAETEIVFDGESMHSYREVKAPSTRYVTAQAKLDAALRTSGDAFDRAVAEVANVGAMRTPAGAAEAVAQQALATADARVYAMAFGVCAALREDAPSCGALTARRWTELDAGNGVPWLEMLKEARARGDSAGQQEALARLASATRFDERSHAAMGAVLRRMPANERDTGAVDAMAMHLLGAGQSVQLTPLMEICRNQAGGNATVARQCQAISDAMYEHSSSLLFFMISGNLQQQISGDASRRDLARAERQRLGAESPMKDEMTTCGINHALSRFMLRSAQIGELAAMREQARHVGRNGATP